MNLKTKTNTVKQILARVMLVVVLLTSVLSLSGCRKLFGNYRAEKGDLYKSHAELVEFIEKYNSKNDGFVSTFISFDFDSNEIVSDRYYEWGTNGIFNDYYDKVYDKYQEYLLIRYTFYLNESHEDGEFIKNAYRIYCFYGSSVLNHNFYKEDELSINLIEEASNTPKEIFDYTHYDSYMDAAMYYHMGTYTINVNGVKIATFSIRALKEEVPQEKLDAICQLLMDNIVIINTEG